LLLAFMRDGTPWTMAWIMAAFTLASAAMALTTMRKTKPPGASPRLLSPVLMHFPHDGIHDLRIILRPLPSMLNVQKKDRAVHI